MDLRATSLHDGCPAALYLILTTGVCGALENPNYFSHSLVSVSVGALSFF